MVILPEIRSEDRSQTLCGFEPQRPRRYFPPIPLPRKYFEAGYRLRVSGQSKMNSQSLWKIGGNDCETGLLVLVHSQMPYRNAKPPAETRRCCWILYSDQQGRRKNLEKQLHISGQEASLLRMKLYMNPSTKPPPPSHDVHRITGGSEKTWMHETGGQRKTTSETQIRTGTCTAPENFFSNAAPSDP